MLKLLPPYTSAHGATTAACSGCGDGGERREDVFFVILRCGVADVWGKDESVAVVGISTNTKCRVTRCRVKVYK